MIDLFLENGTNVDHQTQLNRFGQNVISQYLVSAQTVIFGFSAGFLPIVKPHDCICTKRMVVNRLWSTMRRLV